MNWSRFSKPSNKLYSLLACFVFCLLIPSQGTMGCGVSYPSDYFQVFFLESDLLDESEYESFYYPWYYNYQDRLEYVDWENRSTAETDFNTANLADWKAFFADQYTAEQLKEAIYTVDIAVYQDIVQARKQNRTASLKGDHSNNKFLKALSSGKHPEALDYLLFAKECETWALLDGYWDTPERNTANMATKLEAGKTLRENAGSPFLKDRYAFQLIRLAHYSQEYAEAISLYDTFFDPAGNPGGSTLIQQRSLLLKAGALKWERQFGESMYLFSKVFRTTPPLRKSADQDFGFIGMQHFSAAESYTQSQEERAFLWAMRGFQADFPDLEAIRTLADLDTDQQLLEVLLIRQLNLLEAEVMSPRLTQNASIDQVKVDAHVYQNPEGKDLDFDFDPGTIPGYEGGKGFWGSIAGFFQGIWDWFTGLFSVAAPQNPLYEPEAYREEEILQEDLNQDELLRSYLDFTKSMARKSETEKPELWYLAAGYLEFMRGQYPTAEGLLKNAKKEAKPGSPIDSQIELLQILNKVMSLGKVEQAQEKDLLACMQWLEEMKEQHDNDRILNRSLTAIGQHYLKGGDIIKGILCFAKAEDDLSVNVLCDIYADISDLETLRDKLESGPDGPWESYLIEDFPLGRAEMQDLIGTRYFRSAQFEAAYREFKALPESYWTSKREDPDWKEYAWEEVNTTTVPEWAYFEELKVFSARFVTPQEMYGSDAPEYEEFTKLSFLEKVIDLEQRAKDHPEEAYESYMRIGKAFESTPFWGYSGVLWKGELSWQWQFYYSATQYPFNIPEFSTELYIREHQFLLEYGSPEIAQLYYGRAMESTPDSELAAAACFAAIDCEGDYQTSMHASHDFGTDLSWYEIFKDKYSHTREYELDLATCPMLYAYLNRAVN